MTEPIDQATIQAIDALTKQIADLMEKLNAAHEEVSLHESQQDVMAADMVKLMDQIEYQKKAAKKDYDRIKKLEFRLKQERNKVIDECIEILLDELEDTSNTREEMRQGSSTVKRMESIKDKDYV